MDLRCDYAKARTIEFGLGRSAGKDLAFARVPASGEVQRLLKGMVDATVHALEEGSGDVAQYDPSEKYGSLEHLYLPLEHELAAPVRDLLAMDNPGVDPKRLSEPESIFCYFARFFDARKRRLVGVRRAAQFKGILKKPLVGFLGDAVGVVRDKVFALDSDFDFLVDEATVWILRPSGFVSVLRLQQAILRAVPDNIKQLRADLPCVDWGPIETFASTHPRAAGYLASIRGSGRAKGVNRKLLVDLCTDTGVPVTHSGGTVTVPNGSEIEFLEVLDRRRYGVVLVPNSHEKYRAASRTAV